MFVIVASMRSDFLTPGASPGFTNHDTVSSVSSVGPGNPKLGFPRACARGQSTSGVVD